MESQAFFQAKFQGNFISLLNRLPALGGGLREEQPAPLGVLGRLRPLHHPLLREVPLVAHQQDLGQDSTHFSP